MGTQRDGGALVCVYSLKNLFNGLTRGMSNFCETESLITSSSTSGVKSTSLPILCPYIFHMDSKEKLNVKYLEIDPSLLQKPENFLKTDWIFNSGRQFS